MRATALAAGTLLGLLVPMPCAAQQGSVQVTAAAQSIQGDPRRTLGEPPLQPDIGVSWLQPGSRFGTFQIDLRATRRGDQLHLGRAFVGVRDYKARGLSWSFEGGDTYFSPAVGDYRFANLSTPALTFAGAAMSGRSPTTSLGIVIGKTTAWRNLYGTDADTLDQGIALGRMSHRATDRLELSTRASHVRTGDLKQYTSSIDASDQAGAAARWIVTPTLHVVGDGGIVYYRRRGAVDRELDGSGLAGASFLLPRGWVQVNAARFSPGEMPILNQPLTDRQSVFAAGEYDAFARVRVFGGWEAFRFNLDPQPSGTSARARATNEGTRGFAGIRTPIGDRSSVALRIETGDRRARVVDGQPILSDTGVVTAEWQAAAGPISGVTRYSHRESVESTSLAGSYTVDDASGHVFVSVSPASQLFGNVVATRTETRDGGGSTFLQLGGGGQTQMFHRSLWLRAEGTFSRNVDVLNAFIVPQQSINVGVNGEIARNTIIGVNVAGDRVASPGAVEASWLSRSSVRLTRTFQTGSARTPLSLLTAMARHGGTGSIAGTVFSDWNANGLQDAGEVFLENIPIRLMDLGNTATSRAGEFAFVNVPIGFQQVGIDLSSLPVDFDVPLVPQLQLQLGRGETKHVSFGLVPLVTVSGRVVLDANGNGSADPPEPPMDGAVVVLDGGSRSERTRQGRFRFEAVRSGEHTLRLLSDSLPDGTVVSGSADVSLSLTREKPIADVLFLVTRQDRPELRKVFAPTTSSGGTPRPAPRSESERRTAPTVNVPAPVRKPAEAARSLDAPAAVPDAAHGRFAIQVIALNDPARARAIALELKAAGLPAYLVGPRATEPDEPYRVRVGAYASRAEAESAAAQLEKTRGWKAWVIRER
jgi:hypothetical protein